MLRYDEIDVTLAPPVGELKFDDLPPADERIGKSDAKRSPAESQLIRSLSAAAESTQDAKDFTEHCLQLTEVAIRRYAKGKPKVQRVVDERRSAIMPSYLAGVAAAMGRAKLPADDWRYFRVRVLRNGYSSDVVSLSPDASLSAHNGYVIVFDTTAPWLEEAIKQAMDDAGYPRTLYVARLGYSYFRMPHLLAYALPSRPL